MSGHSMSLANLRKRIAEIEAEAPGDDEAAHSSEDRLRHDVLVVIANGAPNARELAREVLKTSDIDFARWCA